MTRSETWQVVAIDKAGHRSAPKPVQLNFTNPATLLVGTSQPPELGGPTAAGFATLASRLGRTPTLVRVFEGPTLSAHYGYGYAAGAVVSVDFKGDSNGRVSAANLANLATFTAEAPAGTIVTFHAEASPVEMPGDPRGVQYRASCRQVSAIVRANGCLFSCAPMAATLRGNTAGVVDWRDWVAEPDVVDRFGADTYAKNGPSGNSPGELLDPIIAGATEWGKPPAVYECGVGTNTGLPGRATFMASVLDYAAAHGFREFIYWPGNSTYLPAPTDPLWTVLGSR
ncbi:hypothetical protein ACPPVT_07405 [Angustibacter sp. McL0619]|uniref:hypothetical protein n=1 Tax=Angustibacter sp. McL0619 TaxID=3415676 RepID=UPI003CF8E904